MTVGQAASEFGVSTILSSSGDSLTTIVRRIYNSDDSRYYGIIKALNVRYDWDSVEPGQEISYIDPDVADNIDEIW